MKSRLTRRDRSEIARGANELAVRAGRSQPTRGYRFRVWREEVGERLTPHAIAWWDPRGRSIASGWAEHCRRVHGWKATNAWYQSVGEDEYRKELNKRMERQRGIGAVIYSVERAIESAFPEATEEEWHMLACHIVHEVIHPIEQEDGSWRLYPITQADHYYGPRQSDLEKWSRDEPC